MVSTEPVAIYFSGAALSPALRRILAPTQLSSDLIFTQDSYYLFQ